MQLPLFPVEQRCTDCDRELENEGIPCGCGALLCEACYDRVHQEHGGSFSGLEVHFSSGRNEWYTPRWLLDLVTRVLGRIDLDPCSNSHTQPNVPARRHYTVHEDGLSRGWSGRVFMNPPHGAQLSTWIRKLKWEYESGSVTDALALVPARTDTQWFFELRAYPRCFVHGRVKFHGGRNSAPFPSAVFYLGERVDVFCSAFAKVGDVFELRGNERNGPGAE